MKIFIIGVLAFLLAGEIYAQRKQGSTIVFLDSLTRLPISGITVTLHPSGARYLTDDAGRLKLENLKLPIHTVSAYAMGYRYQSWNAQSLNATGYVLMVPERTQLQEVTIVSSSLNPNRSISDTDISFRGVSNSQEVLRMVPGLIIAQHQGGGKAEQIFLRGFDNDHGKDISLSMDGMPINMVSHAHGQGYADSHFIIPETIEEVDYKKGMFDADKGDLAVSGWVNYRSRDAVVDQVKVEAGEFNTFRGMLLFNLLASKARNKGQHLYIASEYRYSDAYFKNPQRFRRANVFLKYHAQITPATQLSVSASGFKSSWDASGQIAQDDVNTGKLDYFGSVDPDEGGRTSRYNLNMSMMSITGNSGLIKNQFYYSRYNFDLTSNFSFFLHDEINGDEIRQQESRDMLGYNGSYKFLTQIGRTETDWEAGISSRLDFTHNTSLSHTADRYTLLDQLKLGDISQYSVGAFIQMTLNLSKKIRMNIGGRYDHFVYRYKNKLSSDSIFRRLGKYGTNNGSVSPKLSFYYSLNDATQLFLFMGKGLNTNDVRSVLGNQPGHGVPAAYGADLGAILKPSPKIILSGTLWYSYLQQEFVYRGDGGTIDFSGRTRRLGADLSIRFQPIKVLYMDIDLNYARGKALEEESGKDYIPLSPRLSSSGGITYSAGSGLSGSLRYRYISRRPANEDYSLIAEGYLINDLVVNYSKKRYGISLTVNNLFNRKWKESQFVEETRLQGGLPREGITFTPGTRIAATCQLTYTFK